MNKLHVLNAIKFKDIILTFSFRHINQSYAIYIDTYLITFFCKGNNWGCDDDDCGMGFGKQENFINCADIAIIPDCNNVPATTGKHFI
jgi:hypothetical protein